MIWITLGVWFVVALAAWVACYALVRLLFRRFARRAARRELHDTGVRCRCGYDLSGQMIPRCPECGRAIGFDKSFEELGLTQAEIQRLAEVRSRRERQGDADA